MEKRIPKPGEIYDHFKDKPYQIITVATHSENGEQMVVYQALYGDFKTYVRPLEMFISEVDLLKYPDVKQKYRFELRNTLEETFNTIEENVPIGDSNRRQYNAFKIPDKTQDSNKHDIESGRGLKVQEEEELITNAEEGEVNQILMKFLDAESYSKKLEVLLSNKKHLDDRIITDMSIALDLVVDEGSFEQRYQGLINCLQSMCRFENRRLR